MSWTESEKLNEWIQTAFENGRAEEQERIIKLIDAYAMKDLTLELDESLKESLAFVANTYANMGHDFGVIDERERIIKLLEEEIATCKENNLDEHGFRQFDWQTYWDVRIKEFEVVIRLIKGENK